MSERQYVAWRDRKGKLLDAAYKASGTHSKAVLIDILSAIVTDRAGNPSSPFTYMFSSEWDKIESKLLRKDVG